MSTATKVTPIKGGGNVYQLISRVQECVSKEGIAKDRNNTQQGYKFRGIDDVYNALSPILADVGLCIIPHVMEREVVERQTKSGGALFYVTVKVRFDFVSSHDGSKHEVMMFGEAMDSGDKATNKALSAAYKYACMQAFAIPTEGDNDADAITHEVAAKAKSIFSNASLRKAFCDNCISAFNEASTLAELKTIAELNKSKFTEMEKSGNEHDLLAVEELRKRYEMALSKIKQQNTEATQEEAMRAGMPQGFNEVRS